MVGGRCLVPFTGYQRSAIDWLLIGAREDRWAGGARQRRYPEPRGRKTNLFIAQRGDGIDAGGAAGGEITGQERDGDETERDGDKGDGVVGGDPEED